MGRARGSRLEQLLLAVVLAACSAQALWAIRHVDRFPLNDGPQHVFLGHLENVYDDPAAGYQMYVEPGRPLSSRGFTTLFEPLDRMLGWRLALRLTLFATVLLWVGGFTVLVVTLQPGRRWLALLGPATAVQWAFYMGFWSFVVATGFGFLVIAWMLRCRELTVARALVLAALLLAQAMMHAFAAELTGLVLVAIALSRPRPLRSLLLVFGAGVPAATIAFASAPAMASAATGNEGFPPTTWLPFAEGVRVFLGSLAAGPTWRGLPISILALVGAVASAVRGGRGDRRLGRALAAAALLLLFAGLLAPYHLAAWQLLSPRFVPLGVMLGAALLPIERLRPRWATAVVAVILGAHSVGWNVWVVRTNDALERAAEDAMSGLTTPIVRHGPRLPVIIDRALRYDDERAPWLSIHAFAPAMNLGHLYVTEQGGMPPYNFMGTPSLHNFVLRDRFTLVYPSIPRWLDWFALAPGPTYPDLATRTRVMTEVAHHGRDYEDVILYGAPRDADVLVARGYATDHRQGGLFIGHFVGCEGELVVSGSVEGAHHVVAELGMVPIPEPEWREDLALEAVAAPGGVVVPLRRASCGDLWLRVAWVRPPDSGGPVFCEGATAAGALRVDMRSGAALRCTPEASGARTGGGT